MLLVGELQQLYPTYKYTIVPVIIGAFGTVTNELKENLQMLGFSGVKKRSDNQSHPEESTNWNHENLQDSFKNVNAGNEDWTTEVVTART